MIDTIVIRLRNIHKYESLVRRMDLRKNDGYKVIDGVIDKRVEYAIRNKGIRNAKSILSIMQKTRTGDFLVKTQVGSQVNKSSHYKFTYRVDWTREFMEFNFSVPKYYFGTNILMYIEHYRNKNFSYSVNSTWEHNVRNAPIIIRSFIKKFFKKEFGFEDINYLDIEINRIDVCFNQVFNSSEDAEAYLNFQKKIKKKHSVEENEGEIEYKTSFMYKTKRYSAKIYRKGEEYKKHDLKEHNKINKEKGYKYFDTEKLQEFANRILRYELSIRSTELNYLYKRFLFRRNDPTWLKQYREFKKIDNKMIRNDKRAKKIGSLPKEERESYHSNHPYEMVTKIERAKYKEVSKIINCKPSFMLEISPTDELFNNQTVHFYCDKAKFSQSLILLCLGKLARFISEFKIKALPDEERIEIEIDNYNSRRVKHKLPKKEMLDFYQKVRQYGSFKEVRKECRISKATFFRYKARFKLIGVTERNVRPNKEYVFPSAPIDFSSYHNYVKTHNLLRGIKF